MYNVGEMDAEQLWETTMNPLTRRLLKVSVKEAEICNKIISDLMGDSVEPRKEFLLNADIESDLDI